MRDAAECSAYPLPPTMINVNKTAVVPYTAEQMYELVNDVEDYPRFIPGCRSARVLRREAHALEAALEWRKGPLHVGITTANVMEPGRRIEIRLVSGPFRRLQGVWRFEPLPDSGCRVSFVFGFESNRGLMTALVNRAFAEIANSLVDVFSERARVRYGRALPHAH